MAVASAAKLVRTGRFAATRAVRGFDPQDEEQVRARRATAGNRLLTVLKAALNHAFRGELRDRRRCMA